MNETFEELQTLLLQNAKVSPKAIMAKRLFLSFLKIDNKVLTFGEVRYRLLQSLKVRPNCCICGNGVPFLTPANGYQKTCSAKCSRNLPSVQNSLKDPTSIANRKAGNLRTLAKEGITNVWQRESVKAKIANTNLEKFGHTSAMKNDDVKKKVESTNLERYGASCVFGAGTEIRETINANLSEVIKKAQPKIKKTMFERYGVSNSLLLPGVNNKAVELSKSPEANEKRNKTNLERYGVEKVFNSEAIREKMSETIFKKYGVDNVFQSDEVRQKIKNTMIDRYGVDHPSKSEEIKSKAANSIKENYSNNRLQIRLDGIKEAVNTLPLWDKWNGFDHFYEWEHIDCGTKFSASLFNGMMPVCPRCKPRSKPQQILLEALEKLNISFVENTRSIIAPLEIDLWLPDFKIGIEINGRYWHDDTSKVSLLKKTQLGEDKGIQILHFWDTEILENYSQVINIIKSKLGLSERIFARKCKIETLTSKEGRDFLTKHHLQGAAKSTLYLGLKYENNLVGVASFSKARFEKDGYELIRFCSGDKTIVGGLSRLINESKKFFQNQKLITYADRRYSKGNGYKAVGFNFVENTKPNYFYWKGRKTLTRQQAMKHKLLALLGEKFDPTLSERDNMINAGWTRCPDSGNIKFTLV